MEKYLSVLLVLVLFLAGCATDTVPEPTVPHTTTLETTTPATEPEPTNPPVEPNYRMIQASYFKDNGDLISCHEISYDPQGRELEHIYTTDGVVTGTISWVYSDDGSYREYIDTTIVDFLSREHLDKNGNVILEETYGYNSVSGDYDILSSHHKNVLDDSQNRIQRIAHTSYSIIRITYEYDEYGTIIRENTEELDGNDRINAWTNLSEGRDADIPEDAWRQKSECLFQNSYDDQNRLSSVTLTKDGQKVLNTQYTYEADRTIRETHYDVKYYAVDLDLSIILDAGDTETTIIYCDSQGNQCKEFFVNDLLEKIVVKEPCEASSVVLNPNEG